MAPKVKSSSNENISFGPVIKEGELVFGVAHVYASFNDTFVVSVLFTYLLAYYWFVW